MNKYRSLHISLKGDIDQLMLFSNESFRTILDYLNEDKFIMLFDLVDGLYLPCAFNTDEIIAIFRGKDWEGDMSDKCPNK